MPGALLVRAAALALSAALAGPAAASIVAFPPAGSNAFIALYETGSTNVCNFTCTLVASPTREVSLPASAFTAPTSHQINAGGSVSPTAIRGLVSSQSDSAQLDLAFRDTYTVVGGGPGQFAITARLHVTGTISGPDIDNNLIQGDASLTGVIGQFAIDPASALLPTVTPFGTSLNGVTIAQVQSLDIPVPIGFDVLHTRMVGAGEAFDIAWMISAAFSSRAAIDFQNTAAISFDTPDGVFLNAASGAQFGDAPGVPEPGAWVLMISGFGLTGAMLRRRRVAA